MAETVTPRIIIEMALRDSGVTGEGLQPSTAEVNDAFRRLNWLLAQWQRKRWLIWHLVDLAKVATGASSYTIGPSGDINTLVRPDKIESAFVRQLVPSQPNFIDYPLDILASYEDWSVIALKTLVSFPSYVFLDTGYPLGTLYCWPVPQAAIYEIHIQVKALLNQFATLDDPIVLPEEYMSALHYNLAVRLSPAYGQQTNPEVKALAKDALNVLRMANAQIARLRMPPDLIRPGVYNPYSDQFR